jgi:hypothetical protein
VKYLVVFFLLLTSYTLIWTGMSHYFPQLTYTASGG